MFFFRQACDFLFVCLFFCLFFCFFFFGPLLSFKFLGETDFYVSYVCLYLRIYVHNLPLVVIEGFFFICLNDCRLTDVHASLFLGLFVCLFV